MSDDTKVADVSGQRSGGGRVSALVARASGILNHESHWFLIFGFAALATLAFAAYVNHEPIASSVGVLALAVFGGSAWKNHADQAYGNGHSNGNGNGGGTLPA